MEPHWLSRWLFGAAQFEQSEEFEAFRYKFLISLLLAGALLTAVFIGGEYTQLNRIHSPHMVSMQLFTLASFGLWLILRGKKHRFRTVGWAYEIICLMEYTSALWLVPSDALRLLWFFTNIPGVFILLGAGAGWFITVFSVAWLIVSNGIMLAPYSGNAMATACFGMIYMGIFFHVFGARSVSYFERMRDYNQQLEKIASHDMLTSVLNTRAYYAHCKQYLQTATPQATCAVIFIDLDHFKAINDTHGHAAGDTVLKEVAACMRNTVRDCDLVGRIGGEEFAILLPNTGSAGAMRLAETLRKSIENLNPSIGLLHLHVTASIGVAAWEDQDSVPLETIQALQQRADAAMYAAKQQGRNRVCAAA